MRLYTSSRDLPWNSPWAQCGCRVLWSPSRERFIAVWTEEFSQGIQVWAPDATISMKLMVSQCPLPPPPHTDGPAYSGGLGFLGTHVIFPRPSRHAPQVTPDTEEGSSLLEPACCLEFHLVRWAFPGLCLLPSAFPRRRGLDFNTDLSPSFPLPLGGIDWEALVIYLSGL